SPRRPTDGQAASDDDGESSELIEEDGPPAPSSTRIGMLLDALASHLEMIGEGGLAAFRPIQELRGLAARAAALGLSSCARPVVRVVEHLDQQRRGEPVDPDIAARDLLRAYYIVRLAAAQEAVAVAIVRLAVAQDTSGMSTERAESK